MVCLTSKITCLKIPFKAFECTSKVFECPFKSLGWTYKGFCAYNDSRFLLYHNRSSDSMSIAILKLSGCPIHNNRHNDNTITVIHRITGTGTLVHSFGLIN